MKSHYPRIRLHTGYPFLVLRDGLSFEFYMRHAHKEIAGGVLRALDVYLRAVGQQALTWYPDAEGEQQDLNAAGWEQIRRQLHSPSWANVRLYGANCAYRFDYRGKALDDPGMHYKPTEVSSVSFWLPTEFLEEQGPERVRELAMELAAPLPFCSGHGGLSFNGELDLVDVPQEVALHCFRYPGMDVPSPQGPSWHLGTRVRGVHWLSFLGQPVLGELGGAAGLRTRLHSPGTTVQQLEGGRVVVTLGTWPEAGDTERGETLPAYRELARVLEPHLFHEPNGAMLHFMPEETRRWERRFLD